MKSLLPVLSLLVAISNGCPQPDNNVGLLADAVTDFSQLLYEKIAQNNSNVVYSPLSIHMILTMASLGARNDTRTEMFEVLGLDAFKHNSSPHQAYKIINTQINKPSKVTIYTANIIFINPSKEILSQYINDTTDFYSAMVDYYDPLAPEGPEKEINDIVEEKTEGQIDELIPEGTINANTVLLLINTIFFNATWRKQFSEDETMPRDFFTSNQTIQIETMSDNRTANIKRNVHGADVVELPFVDDLYSLYLVVPRETDGIRDLENTLANPATVDELFTDLAPIRVNLRVPKFRIESSFQLKTALKDIGLRKAFDQRVANFQGISNSSDVFISETIHRAVLEVTESGTVAAAATAIVISTTSLQQPPTEFFFVDQPFLFFLRFKPKRLTLFQGKFIG